MNKSNFYSYYQQAQYNLLIYTVLSCYCEGVGSFVCEGLSCKQQTLSFVNVATGMQHGFGKFCSGALFGQTQYAV